MFITQETQITFPFRNVKQIWDSSHFSIKDQNFLIRSVINYKIRQILLPLNINWNYSFSPKNFLCLVCVTCVCIRSFPPLQLNKSRYELILCWGSSIHISPMVSFGLPRHVFFVSIVIFPIYRHCKYTKAISDACTSFRKHWCGEVSINLVQYRSRVVN